MNAIKATDVKWVIERLPDHQLAVATADTADGNGAVVDQVEGRGEAAVIKLHQCNKQPVVIDWHL